MAKHSVAVQLLALIESQGLTVHGAALEAGTTLTQTPIKTLDQQIRRFCNGHPGVQKLEAILCALGYRLEIKKMK